MSLAATIAREHRKLTAEIQQDARRLRRGAARAINRTATTARKEASKKIRRTLNVKAAKINGRLTLDKATANHLEGAVKSTYKPLRVSDFNGMRQTRRGVTVKMRKDKPRKLFRGAFLADVGSGEKRHRGAFIRTGRIGSRSKGWTKGRRRTSSRNLPIDELLGPNDQTIFGENLDDLVQLSNKLLNERLQREIEWAMRQ